MCARACACASVHVCMREYVCLCVCVFVCVCVCILLVSESEHACVAGVCHAHTCAREKSRGGWRSLTTNTYARLPDDVPI